MSFSAIHVPHFSIQAAIRAEPALRDRALVLIAGATPLWNVVAASAAAKGAGIQLGMTKTQVAEFANVEIRERCEVHETAAHAALLDAAWSVSPRVEDAAADTIVLDLEGLESLFGAQENIAQELIWRAGKVGVAANVAVASNIDSAIVAARGFCGVTVIPEGEESKRLGGLPVNVLVVPAETTEILERWGIRTLGALAALPVLRLSERLGQQGVQLHALACGSIRRSLVQAGPSLRFEEEMELDEPIEELEPLSFLLGRLLDQLCARLEARALALRALHVWFALEPSFEKSVQAGDDASREKSAPKEYRKLLTLPVPMRDSKMLLKLLRLQLQGDPPTAPIQKILLSGDAAARRVVQSGLFVTKGPDPEKLELTVARLAKLVGEGNVGAAELVDTHRAENFRMSTFVSVPELAKRPRKNVGAAIGGEAVNAGSDGEVGSAPWGTPAGFRIIRPSVPVRVELREQCPVRVFFRGVSGRVTVASGPWRSSGDWWQEDSWDCDEWDLAIDFSAVVGNRAHRDDSLPECGVYRVFYDGIQRGWFVRGFYD
jgi:protein ImuB